MIGRSRFRAPLAALAACFAAAALPASAQTMEYGDVSDGPSASAANGQSRSDGASGVDVAPYIEAAQIVTAELSPVSDVLTYTTIAAGVDASVKGRNNAASISVRYQQYFRWGGEAENSDVISGIARGYTTVTPGLQIEAGALATRTWVENNGAAFLGPVGDGDHTADVYSFYAGPMLATRVNDVQVNGHYRFGYTSVESPAAVFISPDRPLVDVFDESTVHDAGLRIGNDPGDILPVGIGAGLGYYGEDISNLDQRAQDFHVRIDAVFPVSPDLALLAGVGAEDVEISSRDALRDADGNPVIGNDGQFVTDKSQPRRIAYESEGLIWDVGVMWRPSRRTKLEVHFGERYGDTTLFGSFSYAPTSRSRLSVSAYDNVTGYGGQVNRALLALPTEFAVNRNAVTGELTGCVSTNDPQGGNCIPGALGSIRSSIYRARGISANYGRDLGRSSVGVGAGYDRRRFYALEGTVLALANAVVDETVWISTYMNMRMGRSGTVSANLYGSWFHSSDGFNRESYAVGSYLGYGHRFTDHLSANAALAIDGVLRDAPLQDYWAASALLGMRYGF